MLAAYLDSTNLRPEASAKDIALLCEQAVEYGIFAVCINPFRLGQAAQLLAGTQVKVVTVVGFPLGAETSALKCLSARQALDEGAAEIDMVMNIGAFKDGDFAVVEQDINQILKLKADYDFKLKVIVETALLNAAELRDAVCLVSGSTADFIKTSTGFASRGVQMEDIAIINAYKRRDLQIKASGGIKTLELVAQLLEAGVNRIGTSSAVELLRDYRQQGKGF